MSFLSGTQLEEVLEQALGINYNKSQIKEAAFELTLGDQVYRTDSPTKKREILDAKDSQVIINPGQFALLITEETINIPKQYIAFISIKFSQKIKGLVNVSGFHVDPGFSGKIIFSVYNAGPTSILLDKGKPYFLIWFSPLTESVDYKGNHQKQDEISAALIESLKGELASPNALLTKIDTLEISLNAKIESLKWTKSYIQWIFQAIAVILAGLLITQFIKYDNLETGYQYGLQADKMRQNFKQDLNSYTDSLVRANIDSVKNKIQTSNK